MATGGDVLTMLCNGVEFAIWGDDYDSIEWYGKAPAISKEKFLAGFAKYDAWKLEQDAARKEAKATAEAKLAALGLTTDDLKALGLA